MVSIKDLHGSSISRSKNDCFRILAEKYWNEIEDKKQTFQVKTVLELDEKK